MDPSWTRCPEMVVYQHYGLHNNHGRMVGHVQLPEGGVKPFPEMEGVLSCPNNVALGQGPFLGEKGQLSEKGVKEVGQTL